MFQTFHYVLYMTDPKEETEEEDVSNIIAPETPVSTARPSRGWHSNRTARQCDVENSRRSKSKTGSLQLICKSEPNTDQLEFGMSYFESLEHEMNLKLVFYKRDF